MPDNIHSTVLQIYDAVADDSLWPDILQNFAEQINAVGCIVFEWNGERQTRELSATTASSFYDSVVLDTYIAKCAEHESRDQDVFESHSLRHDQIDLIEDDVLASSTSELRKLPNVQKLLKFGILHRAAGLLNKDNTSTSRFSVQLGENRGRLTMEERAWIATILPHISKALDLGKPAKRLAMEHQGLLAAMDRLSIGVCILDARGILVVENQEFQRQRWTHRTFAKGRDGHLTLAKPEDQKRLERLKENALNHGHFGARPRKEAITTDDGAFLCIELAPLNKIKEMGSRAFDGYILYSTDTSLPFRCDTQLMQIAHGLTDTELLLLDEVAKGLTNAQIAEQRDRSVSTVNAQVKSILSKTQCATRTQLVRLMTSFGVDYMKEPS